MIVFFPHLLCFYQFSLPTKLACFPYEVVTVKQLAETLTSTSSRIAILFRLTLKDGLERFVALSSLDFRPLVCWWTSESQFSPVWRSRELQHASSTRQRLVITACWSSTRSWRSVASPDTSWLLRTRSSSASQCLRSYCIGTSSKGLEMTNFA